MRYGVCLNKMNYPIASYRHLMKNLMLRRLIRWSIRNTHARFVRDVRSWSDVLHRSNCQADAHVCETWLQNENTVCIHLHPFATMEKVLGNRKPEICSLLFNRFFHSMAFARFFDRIRLHGNESEVVLRATVGVLARNADSCSASHPQKSTSQIDGGVLAKKCHKNVGCL